MSKTPSLVAGVSFVLILFAGGCGLLEHEALDHGEAHVIPVFRYVLLQNGEYIVENISEGDERVSEYAWKAPVGTGAMVVDCGSFREIGVYLRHEIMRPYGHTFKFHLSPTDPEVKLPKHFTFYEGLASDFPYAVPRYSYYFRAAARFREPAINGVVSFKLTHRDEDTYSTPFEFTGCDS